MGRSPLVACAQSQQGPTRTVSVAVTPFGRPYVKVILEPLSFLDVPALKLMHTSPESLPGTGIDPVVSAVTVPNHRNSCMFGGHTDCSVSSWLTREIPGFEM